MPQLIEFIGNHPILFISLLLICGFLIQTYLTEGTGKNAVDPQGATKLINRSDAVIVDIRPMTEFSQGHIINAINIPANGLKDQTGRLQKYKNKPIIVSCRSGTQSGAACKELSKQGFEQVYSLRGGMTAWQNANLPIKRKK